MLSGHPKQPLVKPDSITVQPPEVKKQVWASSSPNVCIWGVKRVLQVSSSGTAGKLQCGKLAVCSISSGGRRCLVLVLEALVMGGSRMKFRMVWAEYHHLWRLSQSFICLSSAETDNLPLWGLRMSSIFMIVFTQNTFVRVNFIFWSVSNHPIVMPLLTPF